MRVLLIGASGHIGSFLVPELIRRQHHVIAVSRHGCKAAYSAAAAEWDAVEELIMDKETLYRDKALFASLKADVILDTQSFQLPDAERMCENLLDTDIHLIHIGTSWTIGHKLWVPVTEDHPRTELAGYGKWKAEIEEYLMNLSRTKRLRVSILHPGHITGRGWFPVNPKGTFEPEVYQTILDGGEITLPADGMATLQHVHAGDLARLICACIAKPEKSVGESFFATAADALTLRGFAEQLYAGFGKQPNIRYADWDTFIASVPDQFRKESQDHIRHSPVCSMEKARYLLGFTPEYRAFDAVMDAITCQLENGGLTLH